MDERYNGPIPRQMWKINHWKSSNDLFGPLFLRLIYWERLRTRRTFQKTNNSGRTLIFQPLHFKYLWLNVRLKIIEDPINRPLTNWNSIYSKGSVASSIAGLLIPFRISRELQGDFVVTGVALREPLRNIATDLWHRSNPGSDCRGIWDVLSRKNSQYECICRTSLETTRGASDCNLSQTSKEQQTSLRTSDLIGLFLPTCHRPIQKPKCHLFYQTTLKNQTSLLRLNNKISREVVEHDLIELNQCNARNNRKFSFVSTWNWTSSSTKWHNAQSEVDQHFYEATTKKLYI